MADQMQPSLKALTGSPKQVAWANDIRTRTIEALLRRFHLVHMPGAPMALVERLRPVAVEIVNDHPTEARRWIQPIGAGRLEDGFWPEFEVACLRCIRAELQRERQERQEGKQPC